MLLSGHDYGPKSVLMDANGNGHGRVNGDSVVGVVDGNGSSSVPTHPLGVKPLGNRYLHAGIDARQSIGSLQTLPDEMLMLVFELLDQRSLQNLGHTCRFQYAFCHSDELWKPLFLEYVPVSSCEREAYMGGKCKGATPMVKVHFC